MVNFKGLFNSAKDIAVKHAPELLAGTGIGLWLVGSIAAVANTPKACKDIQEKKEELHKEELSVGETVKAAGKNYIFPVLSASVGTACIFGSVSTSANRYLALSTAYEFLGDSFRLYKDKVVETVGEKKEKDIQKKVAEERVNRDPELAKGANVVFVGNNILCMDSFTGQKFQFSSQNLLAVQNEINHKILNSCDNAVSLNELMGTFNAYGAKDLDGNAEGLEWTKTGYNLGWSTNYLNYKRTKFFEFRYDSVVSKGNVPCLVISYNLEPDPHFREIDYYPITF